MAGTFKVKILKGAKLGLALALVHFCADLLGAFLAIGFLFDARPGSFALLALAGLSSAFIGIMLGAILGVFWPAKLRFRLSRQVLTLVGVFLFIGIGFSGYTLRASRHIDPLPERPALSQEKQRPPILWVVMDTLRADALYGPSLNFPYAPNLARFAQNALVFKDAESSAGWTIPAMATLLTGIHNTTTDASSGVLPRWTHTFAEYLYADGYATHALVDNAIVEPRVGFAQGYESYFQRTGFRFAFSLPAFRVWGEDIHNQLRELSGAAYYGSKGLTDKALEHLEVERQEPLFLYVHYMDPHAPYYAHPELTQDPAESEDINYYRTRNRLRQDIHPQPSAGQLKRLTHRYNHEILAMDQDIGRLLRGWQKRFGQNTLILLTSDHGEEFLDHGRLSHSHSVHRELVHVPLLMQFPQEVQGALNTARVIDEPLHHLDVLPTMLDYLQIKERHERPYPQMQGVSILEALRKNVPFAPRPMVSSHSRLGKRTYRYRDGDHVYIKDMYYDGRPTEKYLYFLEQDPGEQKNLIADREALQASNFNALSAVFEKRARALVDMGKGFDVADEESANIESLRALGYVH
jgi:arylsulfatase A-like enzyme